MRFIFGSAMFVVLQQIKGPHCDAFSPPAPLRIPAAPLSMVGGRGWENSGYLDNLDGDDDDILRGKDEYDEFRERREAFLEKQRELMKTEQGRKFLEMRQKLADKEAAQAGEESAPQTFVGDGGVGDMRRGEGGMFVEDGFGDLGDDAMSSGGGSRMRDMMRGARMNRAGQSGVPPGMGPGAPPGMGSFGLVGMDEDTEGEGDDGETFE